MKKGMLGCLIALCATNVAFAYPENYASVGVGGVLSTVTVTVPYYHAQDEKSAPVARFALGHMWDSARSCIQYGVETGFESTAKIKHHFNGFDINTREMQFDVLAVADYRFATNWNTFAKFGPAYAQNKMTFQNINYNGAPLANSKKDNVFAKGAIGVGYQLSEKVNLNLTYERNIKDTGLRSNLLAGIQFAF